MLCIRTHFQLITKATRITETSATLIDHVWVTSSENNISNYIMQIDIIDHFPLVSQFVRRHFFKPETVYINKRIITLSALEAFNNDISEVGWNDVLESSWPDKAFDVFFNIFYHLFQENFPNRKIKINTKKDRSPYVTTARRNSIKEKNKTGATGT